MQTLDDFKIGSETTGKSGMLFSLIAKAPYVRKDGAASGVLTWQAVCAREGCGGTFTVTTGLAVANCSVLQTRHCQAHRMTQAEIMAKGRATNKERARLRKLDAKQAKAAERERIKLEKEARRQAAKDSAQADRGMFTDKRRKLTDEDVAEIRKLSAEGLTSSDLAMVFPVSSSAIRNILGGRRRP